MNKSLIALLPLKGHSERVPGKNLKLCAGKPLFLWILETLISSDYINQVIINTDSEEIIKLCHTFGKVKIHQRPEKLRGDMVSMNDIIAYDIANSEGELYLQTHATNPCLKKTTIDTAIKKFSEIYSSKNQEFDSLFSVTEMYSRFYDHKLNPINHDPTKLIRTQDLDPLYEENSNLYLFSKTSFNKLHARIGANPFLFPMNKHEAIDIDTPQDFSVAQTILLENK